MRRCDNCCASLGGMRPQARFCSASCRRAHARSSEATEASRDALAASLLLRQTRAVRAFQAAQLSGDSVAADAATRALDELAQLTAQLFGAPTTPGDTP